MATRASRAPRVCRYLPPHDAIRLASVRRPTAASGSTAPSCRGPARRSTCSRTRLARGSLVFDYLSVHETPRGAAIFRLGRAPGALPALGGDRRPADASSATTSSSRAPSRWCAANPGCTALKVMAYVPSEEVGVVPMDERVSVAMAAYDPVRDVILKKPNPRRMPAQLAIKLERTRRRIGSHLPMHAKAAANYLGAAMATWAGAQGRLRRDRDARRARPSRRGADLERVRRRRARARCARRRSTRCCPASRASRCSRSRSTKASRRTTASSKPDELLGAREAFLASTSVGVWPVASVDKKPLPAPVPGSRQRAPQDALRRDHRGPGRRLRALAHAGDGVAAGRTRPGSASV